MSFLSFLFSVYRFLTYPVFWLIDYLWKRLILLLSEKKQHQSFTLYSFANEDSNAFFEVATKALSVLAEIDPFRFERVKKYIRRIVYLKFGVGHYQKNLAAFFVDSFLENDPVYFASELVHEATHGHLDSKGIAYIKGRRERIERLCVKEQERFLKKTIYRQAKLTGEEKKQMFDEWKRLLVESLETRWWEPHKLRARQMKRLKEIVRGNR